MHSDEYQKEAAKTAVYPNQGYNLTYPTLGLFGEAGEVAELVKKLIRDDAGQLSPERRERLLDELGDVCWYIAAIATELRVSLSDVMQRNLDKLKSRQERDKLHGDGDDR